MQYFDVNIYRAEPDGTSRDIVESRLVAFDGHVTRELVRVDHLAVRQNRKLMQGFVQKGFISGKFNFAAGDFGPFREVWYMGTKTLAKAFRTGKAPFRLVGPDVREGLHTLIVEGSIPRRDDDPNSKEVRYRFWLCPERGFLPIKRVFTRDGQTWFQQGLHDLQMLPNGAWFPRRISSPADDSEIGKA
ncbi:MAG: hypothetical protein QHH07_03020 [Sedimentisphaerales bacterium]|nr:hypothetical protein [Sedimentisphaerales bacterium]